MSGPDLLKFGRFYPRFATRVSAWHDALKVAPRISIEDSWTRDMPADRLRRKVLSPAPKLLAPIGHLFRHNRYTRKDGYPSLYLSDGMSTVLAEVFGAEAVERGRLGTPKEGRLTLPVTANLPDVIDLTQEAVLQDLGITSANITEVYNPLVTDQFDRFPGYELPQCLGELANDLGVGALKYPSAPASMTKFGGTNVVIFTDNLASTNGWYEVKDPVSDDIERWPPPDGGHVSWTKLARSNSAP